MTTGAAAKFPKAELPVSEEPTRIYLDYNASTPIAPAVAAAMRRLLDRDFGNPSSGHWAGRPARDAIREARRRIASLLGCDADEIVLTSGGSEANNQVVKGVALRAASPPHIVTTAVEHPAILEPCRFVESLGARITVVPVDRDGLVDPDDVRRAIVPDTALVSVMHANNEVGTIEPVAEIARIAREHGVLCHTDAAQSAGKIPVRVRELGVDLLSLAGHKLYAPKGVGALFVRRGVTLASLVHGGGHEGGRRAGTESALLAAGLGAACHLAETDPCEDRLRELRDRLWNGLRARLGDRVVLNGHPDRRLPNTLNVSLTGCYGDEILARVPEIAASTGSACHTGQRTLSPVLAAMGVPPAVGHGAVRLSVGRGTTEGQVDAAVERIAGCL